jgi:hypothetical protein
MISDGPDHFSRSLILVFRYSEISKNIYHLKRPFYCLTGLAPPVLAA